MKDLSGSVTAAKGKTLLLKAKIKAASRLAAAPDARHLSAVGVEGVGGIVGWGDWV